MAGKHLPYGAAIGMSSEPGRGAAPISKGEQIGGLAYAGLLGSVRAPAFEGFRFVGFSTLGADVPPVRCHPREMWGPEAAFTPLLHWMANELVAR